MGVPDAGAVLQLWSHCGLVSFLFYVFGAPSQSSSKKPQHAIGSKNCCINMLCLLKLARDNDAEKIGALDGSKRLIIHLVYVIDLILGGITLV